MSRNKIFLDFNPKSDSPLKAWLEKPMRTFSEIMIELESANTIEQLNSLMSELTSCDFYSSSEKLYGLEEMQSKCIELQNEQKLKLLLNG